MRPFRPGKCSDMLLARWLILSIFLLLNTGCFRIWYETEESRTNPAYAHHEDGLYVYKGTVVNLAMGVVYFPPVWLELPVEVVADTLLLPVDLLFYAKFRIHPSLTYLAGEGRLEELERQLKGGADPNEFYRPKELDHGYFPLGRALKRHQEQAFAMLLDYGAKVPPHLFNRWDKYDIPEYRMCVMALNKGFDWEWLKEKGVISREGNGVWMGAWVEAWLSAANLNVEPEACRQKQLQKRDELAEIIRLLLHNGCSIAPSPSPRMWRPERTMLDKVLEAPRIGEEDRRKMAELLRAHGAMTYRELVALHPELPHLPLEGLDIDPMFMPAVDALVFSEYAAHGYRFSTSYEGFDGPVLVIDCNGWRIPPQKGQVRQWRKSVKVKRRPSDVEGAPSEEDFEMPQYFRVVLTPPGRRLPPRAEDVVFEPEVFREEWYSLPLYEMYVEYNVQARGWNWYVLGDHELACIVKSAYSPDEGQKVLRAFLKSAKRLPDLKHEIP